MALMGHPWIQKNGLFPLAAKIVFAIGDFSGSKILAAVTGTSETVIDISHMELFRNQICRNAVKIILVRRPCDSILRGETGNPNFPAHDKISSGTFVWLGAAPADSMPVDVKDMLIDPAMFDEDDVW